MTLQFMGLSHQVAIHFNSTFLYPIKGEKDRNFDALMESRSFELVVLKLKTWICTINFISFILQKRKFNISIEDDLPTSTGIN